ncbi:CDP-diacylglycerol--glycerol-3-phosphate 3-phosphatidyltransferase [Devosia enhydra]|uniref:CDP-diacylglycerol--glycerol-3-phosphate 3-phosphatidyltransferase n=1 Tax=Devosia enhydra TaxID=665118 RepID=A0A1K2HT93_9HYPH|nr:CDP-diacylglycerol--glycerol-3-phosphate 3-phosphatidyltransferase [Devosia enhydra]SFZ81384.1 CDP-diacylglycerol--glycerol-3-phosphate 3-phosphatidyltransferase [Devosia enhydra]
MTDRHPSQLTSLPNLVTFARIAAVPVVCVLIAAGDDVLRWIALILFVVAAASDWLDGWLARRSGLVSPLGRMLDPIADKLLVGAAIVILAWDGSLSGWDLVPALAILLREIFVSGLREFLGAREVVVKVTALAKWKTTVQLAALAAIILQAVVPGVDPVASLLLWVAGAMTAWTGAQYLIASWPHLDGRTS